MFARVLSPVRSGRSVVATLLAMGVAFAVGIGPATLAHAAPSAQDLENQINALWIKAEKAIEDYNGVHEQLLTNRAKVQRLEAALKPLKSLVDQAYAQVGVVSSRLYERGPGSAFNAVLTAGTPTVFVDELSMLDQMAKQQQATLADVKDKVDQYNQRKKPLDLLVAKLNQQDAELAAKKRSIQTQLDKLQKLRLQVYGSSGGTGGSLKPVACPQNIVSGAAETAASFACSAIGKPYNYASAGPNSYDCSGLTMRAWAQAGVSLPHQSAEQYTAVTHVSTPRTGDLVFFNFGGTSPSGISHVGIYIGNGWMVHAPHDGDVVREAQVASEGAHVFYGRP